MELYKHFFTPKLDQLDQLESNTPPVEKININPRKCISIILLLISIFYRWFVSLFFLLLFMIWNKAYRRFKKKIK